MTATASCAICKRRTRSTRTRSPSHRSHNKSNSAAHQLQAQSPISSNTVARSSQQQCKRQRRTLIVRAERKQLEYGRASTTIQIKATACQLQAQRDSAAHPHCKRRAHSARIRSPAHRIRNNSDKSAHHMQARGTMSSNSVARPPQPY